MATKICFPYEGVDYRLEYNKKTVKIMEDRGFIPSKILEAPMSYLPELFAGAFLANHKFTKRDVIDKIYGKLRGKSELVNTLLEMYNEPIKALTEDEDEGNAIEWTKE